jgi:hypothetical protein
MAARSRVQMFMVLGTAHLWNAADGLDMVVGQRIKLFHSPCGGCPVSGC